MRRVDLGALDQVGVESLPGAVGRADLDGERSVERDVSGQFETQVPSELLPDGSPWVSFRFGPTVLATEGDKRALCTAIASWTRARASYLSPVGAWKLLGLML
ncbi:MAG: hypothetical protein HOY76_39125 [Streptomyces sp.]|nr:hypothetical protein [Streptomyces sp.]